MPDCCQDWWNVLILCSVCVPDEGSKEPKWFLCCFTAAAKCLPRGSTSVFWCFPALSLHGSLMCEALGVRAASAPSSCQAGLGDKLVALWHSDGTVWVLHSSCRAWTSTYDIGEKGNGIVLITSKTQKCLYCVFFSNNTLRSSLTCCLLPSMARMWVPVAAAV